VTEEGEGEGESTSASNHPLTPALSHSGEREMRLLLLLQHEVLTEKVVWFNPQSKICNPKSIDYV